MSRQTVAEVLPQIGQADRTEACDQESLRLMQGTLKSGIDDLFDSAIGVGMLVADREQPRPANGPMDVEQRYISEIACDDPAAAMPLVGADVPRVAQAGHGAPHDDRIGAQHRGNSLRRHGPIMSGHVQQNVEHSGQAAVFAHLRILRILFLLGKRDIS